MSASVVCFGEILLRLSAPSGEVLLQSPRLEARFGGAEANVAVALARWGRSAAMVSRVPESALGRAAADELRRHGIRVDGVRSGPGRMGLYFLTPGAVLRPSEVLYDRADSAFAAAAPESYDWPDLLTGADWLHLSGITPAVSPTAANAALGAVRAARALGVKVSFDGNYRAKLWEAWSGDGRAILRELLAHADLAFIDDRDVALILGRTFDAPGLLDRRRQAAAVAFEAFSGLQGMASTVRVQHGAADGALSALMFGRDGAETEAGPYGLTGVVDRIGTGDAFAAGVLYGMIAGEPPLEFGLASAALKHSIAGDFNLVTVEDVHALAAGGGLDVRR